MVKAFWHLTSSSMSPSSRIAEHRRLSDEQSRSDMMYSNPSCPRIRSTQMTRCVQSWITRSSSSLRTCSRTCDPMMKEKSCRISAAPHDGAVCCRSVIRSGYSDVSTVRRKLKRIGRPRPGVLIHIFRPPSPAASNHASEHRVIRGGGERGQVGSA